MIKLRVQPETNSKIEKNSNDLAYFSGRFDDLGENLLKLSPNEHICTIYRKDEDKIDSIMEFLKTGIVKKERCVIIVDNKTIEDIQTKIKASKEIKNLLNTSALEIVDSEDIYGNKSEFNLARTIESIEAHLEIPQEDKFNGLRLSIEILPLNNKDSTMNISMELHSFFDKLISNKDISFFCLYNEYKFDSRTLLEAIITHSKLIFNGYLCRNVLFMDPHQLQLILEDRLDETLYKKTVYEIVQREIAEQKREKEVSHIQTETLKGINDSAFIIDFKGNILEVNEAAYKTRGYTEEEMLSLNILDIMTSVNRDLFDSRIEELKKKGEITFETTHNCKYGSVLDVEFKAKIISYDNQQSILSVGRDITERRIAKEEAKTSEEKFRTLFNEMKQAYALYEVIYDRKGDPEDAILVEVNSEYEKLTNKKREEIIGKKITEIYPNMKKQEVNPIVILGRTMITGQTVISEYYNKDIGKWLLAKSFSPMRDHVAVLYEDITEKRKIEGELEKERKTMKQYLDIANIILTVIDTNENVILVNKKGCELLGYDKEDIIGKNWFDNFLPERVREETKEIFQELLAGKITQSESHENLILTKDGEERLIAWDNTFIRDEEGKIIRTLSSGKDVTEIRKTQRELKDSEEKYRMIFDNTNDAIYLYSIDEQILSNFIEVNDVACNMLGYTKDEFRKMSPVDIASKEIKKQIPEIISKLTTLKNLTFEGTHCTKEGKIIPVEVSAHTFYYHNKQMVLTIARDISERKKSEEKLSKLNEELEEKVIQRTYQMETLYNIIKDISETFDLKEAMEIIAKYISQLIDYDIIVQLITQEGLNLIQIGAPKGNKEVIDDFLKTVKDELVEINPDASTNRDSTTIITSNEKKLQKISSRLSIPLIAEDKVVGLIVVGSEQEDAYIEEEIWFLYKIADNISHTLQRLKVIITAKDELETVLNHTSDGVILLNSQESVVMVNKAANRFLEIIKDSKTNGINNEILDLGELKQIGKKELSLNGYTYYVSMSPIKSDFVHGWLLTIHDITEEKVMQKKILHQERLATLGKMAGGIAHDFNNILASIIGAADFSLMNADNIESKEFLNLIIKQSERGASLIRQMLDFTRQTVIQPQPVSILDFITEFSRVIRSSLPENIILSANTQDWTVLMDQVQLQQLFMNLIFNSRDALVRGGKINITVEEIDHSKIVDFEEIEIDKNREYIQLTIEDNGEGMNEQTRKMIFEPFFTTKDPGKGSGLGLAQVYGIVRQSNGYINVESELKEGTKIHIYIPKHEGLVEEEIVESASNGEGRILLVEDDENVREITKMMLENYGFRVVTAENGKIALDLFNDTFDLVLTDIIMPVMGGEKLIKKVLEINPQVKCLAMTGYSDVDVPEGIKVLNKPITTSKLVNYIQNELDQVDSQEKKVQNEKREDGG